MADGPTETQAPRMPQGKPNSAGLADAPLDTATGTVKSQDGPMDRAGTEAEAAARGGRSLGAAGASERPPDKPARPVSRIPI